MTKVSVSPQNSDSSSERVSALDSPGNSAAPYVNYYTPSQPLSSPCVSDSPPISPHTSSLSPVPERQPMNLTKEQIPPVAPPRSLISLMGSSSSSKC